MVREQFTVPARAKPPDEVIEEAIERQRSADGDKPLEAFLRDHVDIEFEWVLPDELRPEDKLRCP